MAAGSFFCRLRGAGAEPSSALTLGSRGLRGFFSFGFSSLPSTLGSLGLRALLGLAVVSAGVGVGIACAGAGVAEVEDATTPSANAEAAAAGARVVTRISSSELVCGDCTDDRDDVSLAASSSAMCSEFMAQNGQVDNTRQEDGIEHD